MVVVPQIPFDFFVPEAPSFDNFVVGDNAEALARLATLTLNPAEPQPVAWALWGGPKVGKSHLLHALADRMRTLGVATTLCCAHETLPDDPFITAQVLCIDDADSLSPDQQAWLFTAFNHVAQHGGRVVASGRTPPAHWPMRDDIRTRMASGLVFEITPIPKDALPPTLAAHASQRGFEISNEVLTYLLGHTKRDVMSLCQALAGVDRLSLALKRPVTVPLLRAYLATLQSPPKP